MTFNGHWFRRALTRMLIVGLPLVLAGCAPLKPAAGGAARPPAPSPTAGPSLYGRLGGAAGIEVFTDDFLGRATNDPAIIPFFRGLTPSDLTRIRQHVIELLCLATGGGCTYSGKDMKTTHKEMEINLDAWNAFTGHLNETVARFQIQERERNELVAIIESLKKDIVNR